MSEQLFDVVHDQILKNKQLREEGKDISIPFPFPRFSEEIPGIQRISKIEKIPGVRSTSDFVRKVYL